MEKTASPSSAPAILAINRFSSFGLGLLLLAGLAVLTGIALLPFYHAHAGAAYPSVAAIQRSPSLRIVRAAHHWASALLLLLGGLYLLYGLFSHAYRRPLHAAWIASVGLFLAFFLFQLTGHLLPWDSQAVSTAAIETGIAENAPVFGSMQARLLRGGEAVSPQTLTIWYVAHVTLLPILLAVLAVLFVAGLRRAGQKLTAPRAAVGSALLVLAIAAVALPIRPGVAASPADYSSYAARSEWYVLPLHGLLDFAQKYLGPSMAWIGTMVIPGLVLISLLVVPWLDRRHVSHPPSLAVRILAALGIAGLMALTVTHRTSMEPIFGGVATTQPRNPTAANAPNVVLDPTLVQRGKTLFSQNGCAGCHKLAGQGGAVGPPLDGEGSRRPDLNWQMQHLKNPASMVQGSTMPPFNQLSAQDLKALSAFLLSLK